MGWWRLVCSKICRSEEEVEAVFGKLKITACPHCKQVGSLIRHGVLRGYDQEQLRGKTIRARRVFCSNRSRATGCGRTFSVWAANKIKRLFLNADCLWEFLRQAALTGNKRQAFRSLENRLSESAAYRIWKRFERAQSAIRTALATLRKPPEIASRQPAQLTLAHLEAAFDQHPLNPIAAFQVTLQTFFV
jgi:hypothetical protein